MHTLSAISETRARVSMLRVATDCGVLIISCYVRDRVVVGTVSSLQQLYCTRRTLPLVVARWDAVAPWGTGGMDLINTEVLNTCQ